MSIPVFASALRSVRLPVFAAIALITCACAPQSNVRAPVAAPPDPLVLANRQLNNGNYTAAATAFSGLASTAEPGAANRLTALAALAFQDAGEMTRADELLAGLPDDTAGAAALVAIAAACALNARGEFEPAWTRLQGIDTVRLTPYQRGRYSRCFGVAALETGRTTDAATALVNAWQFPYPADQAEVFVNDTWRALSRLPATELAPLAGTGPATSAGWYALAQIAAETLFDTALFIEKSDAWALGYPQHPGYRLLETLVERSESIGVRPRKVALLLPFGAGLEAAAEAVRDGFVTAWYLDSQHESRPEVIVRSSAVDDLESVVTAALAEGTEFIVGPLRKQMVERLRTNADVTANVLALNVTDGAAAGSRAGFYQFGLTPEDEASEVSRRAISTGKRALILAPESAWGHRLGTAYRNTWQALGAQVVREIYYDDDPQAYAAAIKQALSINASEGRNAELRRVLNLPMHFAPRRRQDVDLILLAGFPKNARQIGPQLRYFDAGDIPVFSTSHVFSDIGSSGPDVDLNGITFVDMPWLLGAADHESYNLVRRHWGSRTSNFARLFALGIDAYRVLPYLAKMRFQPTLRVPGVSGGLSMDTTGVLHRHLNSARFEDGVPRPLNADTVRRVP